MAGISLIACIGLAILLMVLTFILISNYIDYRKKRRVAKRPFLSFIMPSYNDAKTVTESIESVFRSYKRDRLELFVINDGSKDDTSKVLNDLKKRYPIKIIDNKKNLGKVRSVNNAFRFTRGKIIIILDSDTLITKNALDEILSRLSEKDIGGVSCRYIPLNKGFLASMQRVEYGMISLLQRSCNFHSTIGFWGGCMAIKREVFQGVGLLSENCIVEDGDLALKIGESGWIAQECSTPVYSYVPHNFMTWCRQKSRWAQGSMQNFINHFSFYMKNPAVIFFLISYSLMTILFVVSAINYLVIAKDLYALFDSFRGLGNSFIASIGLVRMEYGIEYTKVLTFFVVFPLFSIPYVVFNYPVSEKPLSLFLIFPFSIIYFPLFTVVTAIGSITGIIKYFNLGKDKRGW